MRGVKTPGSFIQERCSSIKLQVPSERTELTSCANRSLIADIPIFTMRHDFSQADSTHYCATGLHMSTGTVHTALEATQAQ